MAGGAQDDRGETDILSGLLETIGDGVIVIDAEGVVQLFNPAAARMFGFSEREVVGRNVKMLMPPLFGDRHDDFMKTYIETGNRRILGIGREVVGRRKDGTTFPVELAFGESRLEGRHVFTGILRDITQRKRAEEALRQARSEMQARAAEVARMAEETRLARRQAREADDAKRNFLAAMSHEIRTPMTGVLGMVDALEATGLTVAQRKMIAIIKEAGEDLVSILNNILDVTRIDAGQMTLQPAPVRLGELLGHVRGLWAPRVLSKELSLRVEHGFGETDRVELDGGRVKQVLSNLLGNAVKFTDDGEIVLRCFGEPLDAGRIELRFEVQDSGVGIDREHQKILFRPYAQVMSTRDRNPSGVGLGLAISRQLVRAMGGEMGVTSEPGKGATFWFTLPVRVVEGAPDEGHPPAAAPARKPRIRPGARVLVAEDNTTSRKVIEVLLFAARLESVVVGNGARALELLRREDFDLVLMDDNMPEMDGQATAQAIRGLPGGKAAVPIVALTANAMSGDRERYLAMGMNDYVAKPIDLDELMAVLERWLPAES